MLALPVPDEWRHDHQARPFRQVVELVDHLLNRLARDLPPANRAVHSADSGEEQPEMVVDLGDGADRRSRIPGGALLVDADRGAQPVDLVDVRLLHLPQELACVCAQRLDVSALSLGIDRVESQARLPRARETSDHDQPVARHLDVEVFQVVLARTAHGDLVGGHRNYRIRPI